MDGAHAGPARRRLVAAAVVGIATLTGCAPTGTPGAAESTTPIVPIETLETELDDPIFTLDTEPAATDEPEATETVDPSTTETPGATDEPTGSGAPGQAGASTANRVKIGTNDYGVLDWKVSCSGLDGSPTILATATGPDATKYVLMVLAGVQGDLISLTFSSGPEGAGHSAKSGLTVTPATGQGSGTFLLTGSQVTSDGRGVSYGPYDQDFSVDTAYSVELVCPAA